MPNLKQMTFLDCIREYEYHNGYRYLVTKFGEPHTLCKSEEDALEIANNTENYGLGLSVTDLEKIYGI